MEQTEKRIPWNKGKHISEKTRKKISASKQGFLNPRWNNNASEYNNHSFLKKQRVKILKRAKGKCEICGKIARVVHHIDSSKSNHNLNNLIAVCNPCHWALHGQEIGEKTRTSKYIRKYGMTLKEIGKRFNVSEAVIFEWLKKPERREWIEKQLINDE